MKTIQEIAQWVIDNRYPKNENNKISDAEMYHTLVEEMNQVLRQPPVSGQVCGCSTPKFYQESYHYRKCEHCGKREYPQTLR